MPTSGQPKPHRLQPGEIHVWQAELHANSAPSLEVAAILSKEERKRAARYLRSRDGARAIARWAILRSLLANYLGTLPQDIEISRTEKGKPHLAFDKGMKFSLSSSADMAMFAFSDACAVGIDIEQVRSLPDYGDVARRFFAPSERAHLWETGEVGRERQFFRYWVCKEALLKAVGEGLYRSLDYFVLKSTRCGPPMVISVGGSPARAQHWWLQDFSVSPNFLAALAVKGMPKTVRYFVWDGPLQVLG